MKSSITIKNIAQYLGYSTSTVSKAMNDSPEISITTKNRILKFAKLKGYRPNLHALLLRQGKSAILGVILPDLKDLFYLDALIGITEESTKNDYKIMVYQTCNQYLKEVTYAKLLSESNIIDGLIYAPSLETILLKKKDHLETFTKKGIPIIHIVKYPNFNFLRKESKMALNFEHQSDGFNVGRNAVRYFIEENKRQQMVNLT